MEIKSEHLVNAVQKVLISYEESAAESRTSIQSVADLTKSCYTTISGIRNGKLKSLSVKKALEISARLGGPNDLSELMKLTESKELVDEANEFSKNFPHLYPYEMQTNEHERFLKDIEYARIVWAAFGHSNITREEIRFRWGQEGIDRLEILLNSGFLVERNDLIEGGSWSASFGIDSAYYQFLHGAELYSPHNRNSEENWISAQTQSVNKNFLKEFRLKIREVFKEFNEKSNSSEYQGNIRVYFGMVFDRYMSDLEEGKGELQ